CFTDLLLPPSFPTGSSKALAEGKLFKIWALTNRSYRTTSASCRVRTAFSVSRPGSPGPAETKETFPFEVVSACILYTLKELRNRNVPLTGIVVECKDS